MKNDIHKIESNLDKDTEGFIEDKDGVKQKRKPRTRTREDCDRLKDLYNNN